MITEKLIEKDFVPQLTATAQPRIGVVHLFIFLRYAGFCRQNICDLIFPICQILVQACSVCVWQPSPLIMPLRERKNIAFFTLVTPFCKPLKFGEREREREREREKEREREYASALLS